MAISSITVTFSRDELEAIVNDVLIGIDKSETDSADGWWETSTGAEFGKQKKQELINALLANGGTR